MADKTETPTVEELTDKPAATAADLQFPSDVGKPNVEVAKRSQDVDKASSPAFEKVFVVLQREWDKADQDVLHEANIAAVRQYLVNQGLRVMPDVEVKFVGEEPVDADLPTNPYDASVGLRYKVAAVPAHVAPYEAGTMRVLEPENDSTPGTAGGQ